MIRCHIQLVPLARRAVVDVQCHRRLRFVVECRPSVVVRVSRKQPFWHDLVALIFVSPVFGGVDSPKVS